MDEKVVIGAGAKVGFGVDNTANQALPEVLNTGITLVGKGAKVPEGVVLGRNVAVDASASAVEFSMQEIPSGSSVTALRSETTVHA